WPLASDARKRRRGRSIFSSLSALSGRLENHPRPHQPGGCFRFEITTGRPLGPFVNSRSGLGYGEVFGIGVPAGIRPLTVALDENFGDAANGLLALSANFQLENVFAPGDSDFAKVLYFRLWEFQSDQFSARCMKIGRAFQDI